MKNLMLSTGKAMACLIVMCLFLAQGCRKDLLQPNATGIQNGLSVTEAQQYFNKNLQKTVKSQKLMSTSASGKEMTPEDAIANKQPIWDKAYEKMIANGTSVKVPIDFGNAVAIVNPKTNAVVSLTSLNYLFMYKDSLQAIHTEWIILYPDSAWLYGNRSRYTGHIIVKDWDGKTIKKLFYAPVGSINTSAHIKQKMLSSNGVLRAVNGGEDQLDNAVGFCTLWPTGKCPKIGVCSDRCDMCLQVCAKISCTLFDCSPECDLPSESGSGGGSTGGESPMKPWAPGGGGVYPPDDCGGGRQIPRESTNDAPDPNANSIRLPPCILKPVTLKSSTIENYMGITDPDKQNFLIAHDDVYLALEDYLVRNGDTPENKEFISQLIQQALLMSDANYDNIKDALLTDIKNINSLLEKNELIQALTIYNEFQNIDLEMSKPSYNYLDGSWLKRMLEAQRLLGTLATLPGYTIKMAILLNMEHKAQKALMQTATMIYPELLQNQTENQKQLQFNTNAENSVAIMLFEFATGTGLNRRSFDYSQPITQKYLEAGNLQKVKDEFWHQLSVKNISYNIFKANNKDLRGGRMDYSPDHAGVAQSFQKHVNSDLSRFFISGADVTYWPTSEDGWVEVEVYNETTFRSLFLHMGTNYPRNSSSSNRPLSTVSQSYKFRLKIN